MKWPAGQLHGDFLGLDFYLPSRISFLRERSRDFYAYGHMIADNMGKEITILLANLY
jgi:hypothetical protein